MALAMLQGHWRCGLSSSEMHTRALLHQTQHELPHAQFPLMQVVKCLLAKDNCEVIVVSGAAIGLFFHSQLTEQEKSRLDLRTRVFDSGALQPHAFTVDMNASLDEYMQLSETDREEQLLECHPTLTHFPACAATLQAVPPVSYHAAPSRFLAYPSMLTTSSSGPAE